MEEAASHPSVVEDQALTAGDLTESQIPDREGCIIWFTKKTSKRKSPPLKGCAAD
jgi:hypothetical protein